MTRRRDDSPFRPHHPLPTLLLALPLFLALALAAPLAAHAKTFKLGGDKPAVEITIPPEWETTNAETGVEATAPGAYLSAELIDADDLAEATAASEQFLADRKIVLKTGTKAQKARKAASFAAIENNWEATDPDGPTRVRITIVKVSADKLLLVFYWRSETGERAHAPEVEFILNSLKLAN